MPTRTVAIVGASIVVLSLGGLVASAILLPTLIPVFVIGGTAGGAILGKERLERCVLAFLGRPGGQVGNAVQVDITAAVHPVPTPPPINRRLEALRESLSHEKEEPHEIIPAILNAALHGAHIQEMSLHRHESLHANGQIFSHDEIYNVKDEETKKQSPVL